MANHLAEGTKYDDGKVPYSLFSIFFLEGTARVLAFGATKYEPWNWSKGIMFSRVFDALCRHIFAWWNGEDFDPETGEHHLFHASCCLMFLAHYVSLEEFKGYDNRPTTDVQVPRQVWSNERRKRVS